jgi:manganese transport protein
MLDPRQYRRTGQDQSPASTTDQAPNPLAAPDDPHPRATDDRPGPPGRLRTLIALCGPAFVVAVAYVDPGNFATNMASGATYGYLLLWVVISANLLAMFVQHLSAKVGIATGRNLPELCRAQWPGPVSWLLWAQAELVAMATDVAEFIGSAVALNLLFRIPLLPAGGITAVVSFGLLALAPRGRRRFETAVVGLLAVVLLGFLYQAFEVGPLTPALGGLVPRLDGANSVLLASGIVGATVMPHVVYLHSALTQRHGGSPARRAAALRAGRVDIALALGVAGLVNAAMLVVAAGAFHRDGAAVTDTLHGMYTGLGSSLGPGAALAFALALLAAGLASASVGTYAGQVIMDGFLRRRVPLALRRLVTMTPALILLAVGASPTHALVLSQVALSFGIPFALGPLVALTSRRAIMGDLVNRAWTTAAGVAVTVLVCGLNAFLLLEPLAG